MADAASTPSTPCIHDSDQFMSVSYTAMGGAATCAKVSFPKLEAGSLSLQAVGTWGSATLVLAGSNDGTNWKTCYLARTIATAGKQDVASWTADDAARVWEDAFIYYRVSTSGGTGTSLTVTLAGRRRI